MNQLTYLQGYPEHLLSQMRALIAKQCLGAMLEKHYPGTHDFTADRAFWQHTQDLKNQFLCNALPLNKAVYNSKTHVLSNALGLRTAAFRVQGGKLKAKAETRVTTVLRSAPEPFLRMIVVHKPTHLRKKEHDKASYQLCCHMEPQHYQLGFDTRLWLTQQSLKQTTWPHTGFASRAC